MTIKSINGKMALKFRLVMVPGSPTKNGADDPPCTVRFPFPVVGQVFGGLPALYQMMQPPVAPFPLTTTDPLPACRKAVPKPVRVVAKLTLAIDTQAIASFAIVAIYFLVLLVWTSLIRLIAVLFSSENQLAPQVPS